MRIEIDLTHEYDVQFYLDDDGNICISGNVLCDCYEEEVLQITLSPEVLLKLMKEKWLELTLRTEINKQREASKKVKEQGDDWWNDEYLDGIAKMLVEQMMNTPTLLDRLKGSDGKISLSKKETDDEG